MNQLFAYEGAAMRVLGTAANPLFVAQDVCGVLAISNHRDALTGFADDERGVALTDTPSGQQQMLCVTEAGLYRLIFRSRKPEAEKFRRWVFHEVLPEIRRTGAYQALPSVRGSGEPVQRLSVLAFLNQKYADSVLPPRTLRAFGFEVRGMAKALGVRGLLLEDDLLGEALAWPVKFLETMAAALPQPRRLLPVPVQVGGVAQWALECLVFEDAATPFDPKAGDLFDHYCRWCELQGVAAAHSDSGPFIRALIECRPEVRERGHRVRNRGGRHMRHRGVSLINLATPEAP